jgi:hypothetical protein
MRSLVAKEIQVDTSVSDREERNVRYYHEDSGVRSANNFTIARDASGMIMRKTDSDPERWEVITDPDDLRIFQHCFDERNRLAAAE